jgi:hypothetical protein
MPQMLLFPDPRPLVERLGQEFFRQLPEHPGVYLMRDAADAVLYVGKAKNLRKRLGSYRVANPDRLPRRQLRLLRAVARIELEACPDELVALARESALLRKLRPKFNRAGTWPGLTRFLAWQLHGDGLDLTVSETVAPGWCGYGPMGSGAVHLRAMLVRLLWSAIFPERGLAGMPEGWFRGDFGEVARIRRGSGVDSILEESEMRLRQLFDGAGDEFGEWVRARISAVNHPFELAAIEEDLEAITEFAKRRQPGTGRETRGASLIAAAAGS